MKLILKLLIYAALIAGTLWCADRFAFEFRGDPASGSKAAVVAWFGAFLGCVVLLALRISFDVGRFLGNRIESHILQGEPPPVLPAELTQAELLLKQRNPLAAVNLLRDYLETHPRDWSVQYRIAEIYADQIKNPLAAALEYEALLTRKLDPERWGWTAVRLARLYHQLREFDKAEALLERVTTEHGTTSAARKADSLLNQWK